MHVNEIKTKAKQSQVTFKLTMRSIVRFSTQIMQWYHWRCLHCHTSEWKGRFLINNILFGLAWCEKKITTGLPEHLLTPLSPTSENISSLPYPQPPTLFKVDVIYVLFFFLHGDMFKTQCSTFLLIKKHESLKDCLSFWCDDFILPSVNRAIIKLKCNTAY